MEENTVELYDYFRVIWKRKILIIVVILVCVVVGVGVAVKNLMLKLPPTTYQADAVVKIGRKLLLTATSGVSSTVAPIESPADLERIIPRKYGFKAKTPLGYHLEVKKIGNLFMLELTLKGPDRGVERVLKEIVDSLIDDHHKKANANLVLYTGYINKLEADTQMFQENIAIAEATIKELKRRRGKYLENMVAAEAEPQPQPQPQEESSGGGQSAFLNMLYLKTIDQEGELGRNRRDLRNTQWQLILYQTTIGERDKYHTKMIGEIKSAAIKQSKKNNIHVIIVAGVVGLIMSLSIAFFIEYIEESKSRRKGKE